MDKVTLENYQKLAERTSATSSLNGREQCSARLYGDNIRLLHGAMGLCTEAGEFQDALKRYIFYGKDADVLNLIEECGDILWYVAEILNALDVTFEEVMQKNIDKLRARYPEKFTQHRAINRDLDAENKALQ